MQDRDVCWLLLQRVGSQHVGKEVVVAKPMALIIQRHDKQVGTLQLFQDEGRRTKDEGGVAFVLRPSSFV